MGFIALFLFALIGTLVALELPFYQKVILFVAAGAILVAVSCLPGLFMGWEYTLLVS